MRVAALVLAAGRGERLGYALPKALVPLAGKPMLLHSIETLFGAPEIDLVVPVVPGDAVERVAEILGAIPNREKLAEAVIGGAERQDSVRAGVEALPPGIELVAVHDAARPAVTAADVSRVVAAAERDGAAILATRVRDTIKRVREGRVVETPSRSECWAAQTPQVFRVEILKEALAKAAAEDRLGTDDAEIVEWLGVRVTVVEAGPENLKVTHPDDLVSAERSLRGGPP